MSRMVAGDVTALLGTEMSYWTVTLTLLGLAALAWAYHSLQKRAIVSRCTEKCTDDTIRKRLADELLSEPGQAVVPIEQASSSEGQNRIRTQTCSGPKPSGRHTTSKGVPMGPSDTPSFQALQAHLPHNHGSVSNRRDTLT